jgi:hypothetical protein
MESRSGAIPDFQKLGVKSPSEARYTNRRVLAPVGSNPAAVKRLCGDYELREADRSAVQKHAMRDIVARFK